MRLYGSYAIYFSLMLGLWGATGIRPLSAQEDTPSVADSAIAPSTASNTQPADVIEYVRRITSNLSQEADSAVRNPDVPYLAINEQFGVDAVLAAVSYRSVYGDSENPVQSSTELEGRIDSVLRELGISRSQLPLPPEAEHMMPLADSYRAFEAGVRLARSPYEPAQSFSSLAEAVRTVEKLSPQEAKTVAQNSLALFSRLLAWGKRQEATLSPEEFDYQLERNDIKVIIPTKGRAELNTVDGVKWQNVRVEGSELAFMWENAEQVHPDSKHALRIIASQHLVGGKTRADRQRGRDVLRIRYFWDADGDLKIESIGFYPRHEFLSKAWIRDFALYDGTMPSWADVFVLGIPAGLWQGGVTAGFDLMNKGAVNWKITAFTFFFGGVYCGIFSTNLRRLTNEFTRSDLQRLMANIIVTSLPYALLYKILYEGSAASLNPTSLSGLMVYLGLSVHFWINNVTKAELQGIISDRTDRRLNIEKMAGVRRSNLEQTISYNVISFPARIADLSNFLRVTISQSMNLTFSGGKAWLIGIYPFAKWSRLLHKEWLETPDASKARQEWNRSLMGFFVGLPAGTIADIALYFRSRFWGGTSRDYVVQGDFMDFSRFISYVFQASEDPQFHLRRIAQRWRNHRGMPAAQPARLANASLAVGRTATHVGRVGMKAAGHVGSKCASVMRWFAQSAEGHHPPF